MIQELTEQRDALQELKKGLKEELKDIDNRILNIDRDILKEIQKLGVDRLSIGGNTYTPDTKIVYKTTDWDELYDYIIETKSLFLLHRRLSTKAFDELMELDELPPGVEPETLDILSVRKNP